MVSPSKSNNAPKDNRRVFASERATRTDSDARAAPRPGNPPKLRFSNISVKLWQESFPEASSRGLPIWDGP
eukprot:8760124-Pyramimonas_sp.AAC.1